MSLSVKSINSQIQFTGNKDDDDRVRATEVGVATGATVGSAKYGFNAFKRFKFGKATGDIVQLSGNTTKAIKQAANAGKQAKSLWGKMFANAKTYKNGIMNWAKSTKLAKFMKPVFESKAFAKVSGAIGGIGAAFVFVSGIGEMGNTYSNLIDKN